MKSVIFLSIIAASACVSNASRGSTLVFDGSGVVVGATNVSYKSQLLNASFVQGVCSDFFSGCDQPTDFPFSDALDAEIATRDVYQTLLPYLRSLTLATAGGGRFDFNVSVCRANITCGLYTPAPTVPARLGTYDINGFSFIAGAAPGGGGTIGAVTPPRSGTGYFPSHFDNWIVFSPVPEIPAYLLFILGAAFITMTLSTRRQAKIAA